MNTIQSINGAELPISPTTDGYTVTVWECPNGEIIKNQQVQEEIHG